MLEHLEKKLSYTFADPRLLIQALTHRSFGSGHNERLEFLGDAFINAAMAAWLYQMLPHDPEGVLTRARAYLVRKESLIEYAKLIELDQFLKLGLAEQKSTLPSSTSLIADAFEAVWGAMFLEMGFESCYTHFIKMFHQVLELKIQHAVEKDSKTLLQEIAQEIYGVLPQYKLVQQSGTPHQPTFHVECSLSEYKTTALGRSKKQAETQAAAQVLELIQEKK